MVSITSWMYLIIPGFIYLTAAFFLYLVLAGINHIKIKEEIRPLIPYIAVAVIFISHILGLSLHTASQTVYYWIYPKPPQDFISLTSGVNIPEIFLETTSQSYAGLVMIRHVGISTLILGIIFFIWGRKGVLMELKWYYYFGAFVLLIVIFGLTYMFRRQVFNQLLYHYK